MGCYKIQNERGEEISFDSVKALQEHLLNNPETNKYLQEQNFYQKQVDRISNALLSTQRQLIAEGKDVLSYVHTKDKYFYYAKEAMHITDAENPQNWDAPTKELHEEGQRYVNSIKFKVGTPIHYVYSKNTPYNKYGFPNFVQNVLNNLPGAQKTKLSAVVFVDENEDALPKEITSDSKLLQKLINDKKATVKYVGSFYEYEGRTEDKQLVEKVKKKAMQLKTSVAKGTAVSSGSDTIHYNSEASEEVLDIIGFNKRIQSETNYYDKEGNKVKKDTPGAIKKVVKIIHDLSAMKWLDKNSVPLIGIVRISKGQQYIQLNDGQTIVNPSIVDNYQLGDPVILIPSNVTSAKNNAIKKGIQSYYPVRLLTKQWRNNLIFKTKFNSFFDKILSGKINYTIGKDRIENVKDDSTIGYNTKKEEFQIYWRSKILNQEPGYIKLFQAFKVWAAGKELNDQNLHTYLSENNIQIKGEIYASLLKDTPVSFFEAIQEFMGFSTYMQQDFPKILQGFLDYRAKYNGSNTSELLTEFFEDPNILDNQKLVGSLRSQTDINNLSNQKYFEKYIYPYHVLQTDMSIDRPLGEASFFTGKSEEENDRVPTVEINIPWRNSTEKEKANLTEAQVRQWAKENFPNLPIEFVKDLIDGIATGRAYLATDLIALVDSFLSTGLIKEEFGHIAFKYLSEENKEELFKEIHNITGIPLENKIELEEYLMSLLRKDERELPKGPIERFFAFLKEMFTKIFQNRSKIEEFIDKFHRGSYRNIGKELHEGLGYRNSHSPVYLSLNSKQKNALQYIVNKNFIPDLLRGFTLKGKLLSLQQKQFLNGNYEYTEIQALDDFYSEVKAYIKGLQSRAETPELKEKYDNFLAVFDEPAFVSDLYRDLANSHGLEVSYDLEFNEEKETTDSLSIVKRQDVPLIEKIGTNIKMLLSNIPDILSITEEITGLTLNTRDGKAIRATEIRFLQGVTYNKIDNGIFTFEGNFENKLNSLLENISGSLNEQDMLDKLTNLSESEPWAKILLFKLKEEKELGRNTLLTELYSGIGQLQFVEFVYSSSYTNNEGKIIFNLKSANIFPLLSSINAQILLGVQNFGKTSTGKNVKNFTKLIEKLETEINKINAYNFQKQVKKVMEMMGVYLEDDFYSSMKKGFSEPGSKSVRRLNSVIGTFTGTLQELIPILKNNTTYQGFDLNHANSLSKGVFYRLAQMISSGSPKNRLQTFRDSNKKPRQSYKAGNFLLRVFNQLWNNKDILNKYRSYLGYRYNPLLSGIEAQPQAYALKILLGNGQKEFSDLNNMDRIALLLNIDRQVEIINRKRYSVGNYWIGNLSDSGTAYILTAPDLSEEEIYNNLYRLRLSELDYLFSGVEFDKNFNKNQLKGFIGEGMNELLFGKSILTREDFVLQNYEKIKNALIEKESEVKKLIKEELKNSFESFRDTYKDYLIELAKVEKTKPYDESAMRMWYLNQNYYMETSLFFFMGHPYFSKDITDLFKRSKQWHTDGVYNGNESKLKFIQLKDSFIEASDKFLETLKLLPKYLSETAIKTYKDINATDSQAYGNISMLRKRANENKGWSEYDEQMYQAEIRLDIAEIKRLGKYVSWGPTKLGVYGHEIAQAAFSEFHASQVVIPNVQKFGFSWVLPSNAYRTKSGELIRPDALMEKKGLTKEEVYSQYISPDLAKLCFEQFKPHSGDGIDYAYYGSGAKWGNHKEWDGQGDPQIREIDGNSLKLVTEQPDKNDLKSRPLGIQSMFQMFGMIIDDEIYDLGEIGIELSKELGSSKITGKVLKDLLEKVFIEEFKENVANIEFLKGNTIDLKSLSVFLLKNLQNSQWSSTESLKALDLTSDNTNFKIRPYSSKLGEFIYKSVNYAIENCLKIRVNAPAYKNVASTGGLKTYFQGTNLVTEIRVAMWPELQQYRDKKMENRDKSDYTEWLAVEKEILEELNNLNFEATYWRIPTEAEYSFIRFHIKEFLPDHSGNAIEVGNQFTTQTGGDFDGDSIFGIISNLIYGEKLGLIYPGLNTHLQRQSLISKIYAVALDKLGLDMAVPGEFNRLDEMAKKVKLPAQRYGSLESNLFYQELNDVGSDAISIDAVTMSFEKYFLGYFKQGDIAFKREFPKFENNENSITGDSMNNGESKMSYLTNNTGAAVNMPKDATLTKLGLDKNLTALKSLMTVVGIPFEYSVPFLNAPVIKDFIQRQKFIQGIYTGQDYLNAYNDLLKEFRISGDYFTSEQKEAILQQELTVEDIKSEPQITLIKYLQLKKCSSDLSKLISTLTALSRPQKPDVAKVMQIILNLNELRELFTGIEKLIPKIIYKNGEFTIIPSGNKLMDNYVDIHLKKMMLIDKVSTYYHPSFLKIISKMKTYLGRSLSSEEYLQLNNLMLRYARSKQIKPLTQLLHLGIKPSVDKEGNLFYYPGSIASLKAKLVELKENNINDSNISKMLFTLSQLEYGEEINYIKNGVLWTSNNLRILKGTYSDQVYRENFEQGYITMLNSNDAEIREFAENIRDLSIYKGNDRGSGNIGSLVPATVWEDYEDAYDKILNTLNENEFLHLVLLNFPNQYVKNVSYFSIKTAYDNWNKANPNNQKKLNLSSGFDLPISIYKSNKPAYIKMTLKKEVNIFQLRSDGKYYKVENKGVLDMVDFQLEDNSILTKNDFREGLIPRVSTDSMIKEIILNTATQKEYNSEADRVLTDKDLQAKVLEILKLEETENDLNRAKQVYSDFLNTYQTENNNKVSGENKNESEIKEFENFVKENDKIKECYGR